MIKEYLYYYYYLNEFEQKDKISIYFMEISRDNVLANNNYDILKYIVVY